MANRHKNRDWSDAPNTFEFGALRVLMDIRDELQTLNRLLACRNFTGIPATIRAIQRNTKKEPQE